MTDSPNAAPTWRTLRDLALTDPVLYALWRQDATGDEPRETLLLRTVLWLAKDRQRLIDMEIGRRQLETRR